MSANFGHRDPAYLYEGFNLKIKMFLAKERRAEYTTECLPSIYNDCERAAREQALKHSSGLTMQYELPTICRVMCSIEDPHRETGTKDDVIFSTNFPSKDDIEESNRNGLKGTQQHQKKSYNRGCKQPVNGFQKAGKESLHYDHKLLDMISSTNVSTQYNKPSFDSKTPLIIDTLSNKSKSYSPRIPKDPTVFPYMDNVTASSRLEKRSYSNRPNRSKRKADPSSEEFKIPALKPESQVLVLDDLLATEMCSYEPRTCKNVLDWTNLPSRKLNKSKFKAKTENDPRYSDPLVGASSSFQARISDLAALEAETIRNEKVKKYKRKAND